MATVIETGPRPWVKKALCGSFDKPDKWFPEVGPGKSNIGHDAKKICAACPVNRECLTYAIDGGEENGIWGGAGEKTRRELERIWQKKECDGYGWAWSDIDCQCIWCVSLQGAVDQTMVFDSNGPNATHGIRVTYARGCRCNQCRFAAANYSLNQRSNAA